MAPANSPFLAPTARDAAFARKSRQAALAIAGTMLAWMLMQLIGAEYAWPLKYTLLVDLFALAGFIWALAVISQLWRARRAEDRA